MPRRGGVFLAPPIGQRVRVMRRAPGTMLVGVRAMLRAEPEAVRRQLQLHRLQHRRRLTHGSVGEAQVPHQALLVREPPTTSRSRAVRVQPALGTAPHGGRRQPDGSINGLGLAHRRVGQVRSGARRRRAAFRQPRARSRLTSFSPHPQKIAWPSVLGVGLVRKPYLTKIIDCWLYPPW